MKVVVYSASWCGPCKMLHSRFKQEGITYSNVDVDANLKEANEAGVRGVPTTVITDNNGKETRVVGFNVSTMNFIREVLGMEEVND